MGWLNSRKWWATALVLMVGLPLIVGCSSDDKDPPPPTQPDPTPTWGTVAGVAAMQPGASGDLSNARVAIYTSLENWELDRYVRTGTAIGSPGTASVSFTITNLPPGPYYLDVWKDVDNSRSINSGDLFGVYGGGVYPAWQLQEFLIVAGQTTPVSVTCFSIP